MKKKLLYAAIFVAFILGGFLLIYEKEVSQFYHVIRLFEEERIVRNFVGMEDIFHTVELERSSTVREFGSNPADLPESFTYQEREINIRDWLEETNTMAFLVLKGDDILHEEYFLGTDKIDKRISWSVAKSFLSAAFGVAVNDGLIPDLDVPVDELVPMLKDTGYEGVTIRNVLQMSSGIYFNEDYGDFNSDINRFGRAVALGRSFDEFAASLNSDPDLEQGEFMHYVSLDTHVLGMVLRAATGKTIKEYFEEHLWSKAGFEDNAYFISDGFGEPMVLGGLNMTTRDYARFGMLMRDNGKAFGKQVIPENWVIESTTPGAPHLFPGERDNAETRLGYSYQWWIPENAKPDVREFFALGIYGQFIYIKPDADIVIVKNSADIDFQENNFESQYIAIEAFRAITDYVRKSDTSK